VRKRFIFLLLMAGWGGLGQCLAADPERSVIQIMVFSQQPSFDMPWRFDPVRRSGGSGFVIKGKRIMTNAHVVTWGRQILVRRYQDPKPYVAEVEYVGHDCDLAVLRVKDDSFFENLEPLEFGELPKVRSSVVTYGYPAGGEEISYTRGVVSRIELTTYAHIGNRQLLSVQTDAAINPGNSGGPVIQDDKVVGVAFQGLGGLENAGFFIPPPVIMHFLKDIEDGKYQGFPQVGARLVDLQNPAYRSYLKLPDNNLGARVDSLLPRPGIEHVLKPDDVILKIGEFPVASDGTILYQGNRVSGSMAFLLAQHGEKVPVQLWRGGGQMDLAVPVFINETDRASGYQYESLPRYYVYGGLVFTPLSLDYLRTLGRDAADPAVGPLYYELRYRPFEEPDKARPEPVVLSTVMPDEANANVNAGREMVNRINGVRIEKLEDVVRAFETNTNAFDTIEFLPRNHIESLVRSEAVDATARILKTYGISRDRRL
jgi:S1-C subfamily serine protease